MASDMVWRAVADPTRRRLIELLRDGPRTTGELCRAFPTTRFAIMKHLAVLERSGVVTVKRSGRVRWNALNPEPLHTIDGRWPPAASPVLPEAEAEQGEGRSPAGAGVAIQVYIDSPPWRVFDALTVNVAAWWGAPHLQSPDASALILEPQPGGRFLEEWGHRQGALRGIVSAIKQDERLDLTGAIFGPEVSALRFALERREGGTLLTASLSGAPDSPDPGEDGRRILDDLFRTRLKAFVEHGTRSGLGS